MKTLSIILLALSGLLGAANVATAARISGELAQVIWLCGGAVQQGQEPRNCVDLQPRADFELALVIPKDDTVQDFEVVSYFTTDEKGMFDLDVPEGTYAIVLMQRAVDPDFDSGEIRLTGAGPFVVTNDESAVVRLVLMTPPPPISMGVGN